MMNLKMLKKRKGFTLIEFVVVTIILCILLGVGVYYYGQVQQDAKVSAAKSELQVIATAATSYAMLAMDPNGDSAGVSLQTGLAANESVDGLAHQKFLADGRWNGNKAGSALTDPWGGGYAIDYSARTVTCTPSDTKIGTMVQSF